MKERLTEAARRYYNADNNPFSWEEILEEGLYDFRVYLTLIWAHLKLPEPTPVQLDMALNIQLAPRRFIIQAFRGVGKSWITVAYVTWLLFLNPQIQVLVVSATGTLADDFVRFTKSLLRDVDILQHLQPDGRLDRANKFIVGPARHEKDPSVKAAGIDGQITGNRADIIVSDDIEIPKNSFTPHLREKLGDSVKEFDAILKPGGQVLYLGTPQNEESLYPKLNRERGYGIRIWTAEIPEKRDTYHGHLAPFVQKLMDGGAEKGLPVDPRRFNANELAERRLSYGKAGYALQFMLDTSPADAEAHPLKLRDAMVFSLDSDMGHVKLAWGNDRPHEIRDLAAGGFDGDRWYSPVFKSDEMAPWAGTVAFIDPSGMGKDETAYAIVRYLHGILHVVDVGGFRNGFAEETLEAIAAAFARHGVNHIIDETNYGGGMFRQLLKPKVAKYKGKAGSFDEEWNGWSTGRKEDRILNVLEPLWGSHKVVLDRRVIEKDLEQMEKDRRYSLVYQLTRISREPGILAHDDRLEAVAGACGYFVEKMNRDTDTELERHRDRLQDEELREFKKHVFTVGRKGPTRLARLRRR